MNPTEILLAQWLGMILVACYFMEIGQKKR